MLGAEESGVNYYRALSFKEFMVLGWSNTMMKMVVMHGLNGRLG